MQYQEKENNNNRRQKVTVSDIKAMKQRKEKVSVLTAYDYSTAVICDKSGVDILLVGDSAGCDAVKLEGGVEVVEATKSIIKAGIPAMGHIGLRPQTCPKWEGYKSQGKTKDAALKLIADAKALEDAGVFSIVIEMVASEVAEVISRNASIPIIGIGSGCACDGQVLVLHDMLGIYQDIKPKFVKRYGEFSKLILESISQYTSDVKSSRFPEEQNIFHMIPDELSKLNRVLEKRK
jgi:3-methyl-2-oxobutanoate hydroxymethyltransferase